MIQRGTALGVAAGGTLGHVDDGAQPGLGGGLGEVGGGVDQTRVHRVDEVGGVHAIKGCSDAVEVEQVTGHDLGAERTQRVRACIVAVDERSNLDIFVVQGSYGRQAGGASGPGHQDAGHSVLRSGLPRRPHARGVPLAS
jgi:hypothetical protein